MAETKELAIKELPLVLYTDGGCRETNRLAGCGIHGYFYNPEKTAKEPVTEETWKKDQITNWGYLDVNNYTQHIEDLKSKQVTPTAFVDGVVTLGPDSTNNIAELVATTKAFEIALMGKAPSLTVLTDSEYVIEGVNTNLANWKANGWLRSNGQPVSNRHYWEKLDQKITDYRSAEWAPSFSVSYTQAHCGNYGNERADTLATRGIYGKLDEGAVYASDVHYSAATGYLNPKTDHNKLLAGQHFYFFSNAKEARISSDGRSIYYMGCQGSDEELHGKPVSDSTYIVAYLKEADPVVDRLIAIQDEVTNGEPGRTFMGYLQTVLSSKTYSELRERAMPYVRRSKGGPDLYLDDVLLVRHRNPPMLAWRDEESLSLVRGLLESFLVQRKAAVEKKLVVPGLVVYDRLGHRETKPFGLDVVLTDLSELFFVPDLSKKKNTHTLTEFLGQSTRSVEVGVKHNVYGTVEEAKVPLTVGQDIARRNVLGGILDKNPRLFALTWRAGNHGFYYATVVETDDDVAIWCSIPSNLRALPVRTGPQN